jgi:hypothetical protein
MHLLFQLVMAVATVLVTLNAIRQRGTLGAWLMLPLLLLGALRENLVAIERWLYGFTPLPMQVGRAPLIAAVVWAFSIAAAVEFGEVAVGESLAPRRPSLRLLAAVALFMVALAGFYEPLLNLVNMARWEIGTRATAGVPWIALLGYPSFAVGFLLLWGTVLERIASTATRIVALAAGGAALAACHAAGLEALKRALGW